MKHNDCATCFYCDARLSSRHEHDHMPVPARHDGEETVPTCLNCHDLKDRLTLSNWAPEAMFEAWSEMTPTARIYTAKVYAMLLDLRAARAEVAA